ncbi:MAG: phosphoribosylformylglycinamidine synthase, partial [Blautia sp.]|nr:phosphoribosylformylglycinamidine synthase [Blautia sp.]
MSNVRRIYVEKKPPFAGKAREWLHEMKSYLGITGVRKVRILIRYDVENISDEVFEAACRAVFSEPPVDDLYLESFPAPEGSFTFSVEYLPGQYDQRADSAEQCIRFLDEEASPIIRSAVTYCIEGDFSEEEKEAIVHHAINPVDSRMAADEKPETLVQDYGVPEDIESFEGFKEMPEEELRALYDSLGLAMTFQDFLHIQKYFAGEEHRDPTVTEIRVLDTYWSDHCRHTTFSTELTEVNFAEGDYRDLLSGAFADYVKDRKELYGDKKKDICLMDLALLAMKKLKAEGKLTDQEESEEINACSIVVPVDVDGVEEEWLINFKNETHNHPTEIEPFGGAATCLGGAIRDPLSGRTYVYQAMRVTGAADPTRPASETLKGKLPQKKLVREAAHGYSSYGNQIGLATGYVKEVYHPGYVAKRMEIGAVMGAAPRRAVVRETSDPGDVIILLGGRTGRDGIGGATGSSKVHTEGSLSQCGAEVQKGNAPTERKLQRMFRREEVSHLIKKCNDFGAGGVSVAIGELADGLDIDLNAVPRKYEGLDGTELAISESQERMAVVLAPEDVETFVALAEGENLEATVVATVTAEKRLVMHWNGKVIVNVSREFLSSNGATKHTSARVAAGEAYERPVPAGFSAGLRALAGDLNVCSKRGLAERFDSTIGAATVLMPFGGKKQRTPIQAMVARLPAYNTTTCSAMSWGFNPLVTEKSPYRGAYLAVIESACKLAACGAGIGNAHLTFQEYFERMTDAASWGKPMAALLGALDAQLGLGLGAIGGKDSMSGSFEKMHVPPTLVSFAVSTAHVGDIASPEFKKAGSRVAYFAPALNACGLPDA